MADTKIDLTQIKFNDADEPLFLGNELELKNKTFIFAKNGSGKSTLTDSIGIQKRNEFDVHIFKGFESVLGENDKLNAFALAMDAGENQQKIKELEKVKLVKEAERERIVSSLENPNEENLDNYFTKRKNCQNLLNEKKKMIDKFFYESGKYISSHQNPALTGNQRGYNKNTFKNEMSKKSQLQEIEITRIKDLLKSESRIIDKSSFDSPNYERYLISVNEILQSKVEEKTRILRLSSQERINFAQRGLEMYRHDGESTCAFCGNEVSSSTLEELENYFSADEVKLLRDRISKGKFQISNEIKRLSEIDLSSKDFYPDFISEVNYEIKQVEGQKREVQLFLEILLNALEVKEKNLFSESDKLEIPIFPNIDLSNFNKIIIKNNVYSNNLVNEQKEARDKLRYHEIYNLVEKAQYPVLENEFNNAQKNFDESKKEYEFEEDKKKVLEEEIQKLDGEIFSLKPIAEKQAVEHINKKLRLKVQWELDFYDGDSGYYRIKQDGKYRGVKELSTGEKNVIAFLYFIERLEAIEENNRSKKIIIFDDPMSSNDDMMQYLIINELQKLYSGKEVKKFNHQKDFIVILTHNIHFYLNVQPPGYKDKNGKTKYDKCNFYRITNRNFIQILSEKEDFKTSYESLWIELKDLYLCGHKNSMLNSMRRIIETYMKFNSINQSSFYKDNEQYLKLFNVNSHSIDDLSAETFTEDKEQMKLLFKQIFVENNAGSHFDGNWKD
jgi:wobble nucleotide-excising tRNase